MLESDSLNSNSGSVNGLRNLGLSVLIWNMGTLPVLVPRDRGLTDLIHVKL